MTPREKAKELFEKYFLLHESVIDKNGVWVISALNKGLAKKCALIAVDLHLEELSKMKLIFSDRELHYKYWKEVKQEIENYE